MGSTTRRNFLARTTVAVGGLAMNPFSAIAQEKEKRPKVVKFYYNSDRNLQELVDEETSKGNKEQKKIVISKSNHRLEVYIGSTSIKEYEISISENPIGDKVRQGDKKTPEGTFYIARKHPTSTYYKALVLGFPSKTHADKGKETGLINDETYKHIIDSITHCTEPPRNTGLGSLIEIHGNDAPGSNDWTWGCIALTNEDMDELFLFSETGCYNKKNIDDPQNYKTLVIINP